MARSVPFRNADFPCTENGSKRAITIFFRERKALFETDVTAIFCFSDVQAYGVCAAAGERGMKIPSELSVAGFDDVFGSALFRPSLTTLRQPAEKIARAAAGALGRAMKGENKIESAFFPAELIARESTAPLNG